MNTSGGSNNELERLWKKAVNYAVRRGLGDEAEDFASDLIQRKLEGKSQHASLDQSFMDYSRALRANKRVLGSPSGYCSKNLTISLDRPVGDADDDGSTFHDIVGVPGDDMELRAGVGEISEFLDGLLKLIKNTKHREEIRNIYLTSLEEAV